MVSSRLSQHEDAPWAGALATEAAAISPLAPARFSTRSDAPGARQYGANDARNRSLGRPAEAEDEAAAGGRNSAL